MPRKTRIYKLRSDETRAISQKPGEQITRGWQRLLMRNTVISPTRTRVCSPRNATGTLQTRKYCVSAAATSMGINENYKGGGRFSTGKFLPGKIPPQSLKVMGKIAPHFSMVKGKA